MAETYATKGLPEPPSISVKTIPMAGLLVDVYGLEELPANVPVSCLWLLHPRTRTRARMHDIAKRTISAYMSHAGENPKRGLIALTFDMPNHGTRLVSEEANHAWDKGNATHAIDMFGMVKGGVLFLDIWAVKLTLMFAWDGVWVDIVLGRLSLARTGLMPLL